MLRPIRLLVLSAVGGAVTGLVVFAFLRSLDAVTDIRLETPWLVWLLPVVGIVVAATYHAFGGRAKGGTPGVIAEANVLTHGAPARMAPLIFAGASAGHLVGASVGREGAALQLAASVTDTGARALRLGSADRRYLLAASLAGGWGAAFGVPVTGVVFTWCFARHQRLRTVPLSIASALVGRAVVQRLGYDLSSGVTVPDTDWGPRLFAALVLAGIAFGLLARLFVALLHGVRRVTARRIHAPAWRAAAGGVVLIGYFAVFGRDTMGLSLPLLREALAGDHVRWFIAPLKLVATALSLGTGFVGGEVAPLFVIGGTAGASLAGFLALDGSRRLLLAALGSTVTFAAAASAPMLGVVLAVERFGWHALVPALVVSCSTRVAAGRPGLYTAHH
ncbi:MAG: chloride channel protein [Ilumatobacteraceae bacterium]